MPNNSIAEPFGRNRVERQLASVDGLAPLAMCGSNVIVNVVILGVVGTLTAMGEEIGWRGYLQPRLDAAGVRWSVAVVWLCQLAYHAPLIAGAGYVNAGSLPFSLVLFAAADLPLTFLWARESYRARSLWPAVLFHSFHNTISQWLFPKFFAGGENERLLGEGGLLPVAGYVLLGLVIFGWTRRGPSWRALFDGVLAPRCRPDRSWVTVAFTHRSAVRSTSAT